MGKLNIVATPIGNLKDMTVRGIETLKNSDFVLAEDSREAKKILNAYDIDKPILVYNQHSGLSIKLKILQLLNEGKNLALTTDAGTPGISDPGNELIEFLLGQKNNLEVVPIPGPSALASLLSVCGLNISSFTFLGFFPKKKRRKLLSELVKEGRPFVFFESPHRIIKTLREISDTISGSSKATVGRELTKLHETIYRGTLDEVIIKLEGETSVKGEIVALIKPEVVDKIFVTCLNDTTNI